MHKVTKVHLPCVSIFGDIWGIIFVYWLKIQKMPPNWNHWKIAITASHICYSLITSFHLWAIPAILEQHISIPLSHHGRQKRQTCEIQRCFREDNKKWSNTLVRISPWQLSIGQCIILKRIFKLRMHAGRILHLNREPIELLTTMTCARTTETETALHCGSAKQTGDFPGSSQIGMAEVWAFLHFFLLCHVKFLNAPGWLEGNLERCGRILTLFQEDSRDWKMLRVRKNSSREGENEEIGHEEGDSGSGKSGLRCNIKLETTSKFSEKV